MYNNFSCVHIYFLVKSCRNLRRSISLSLCFQNLIKHHHPSETDLQFCRLLVKSRQQLLPV